MELAGRVALVTGAGSGLGRSIALAFAAAGAALALVDVDEAAARRTLQMAGGRGDGVRPTWRTTAPSRRPSPR